MTAQFHPQTGQRVQEAVLGQGSLLYEKGYELLDSCSSPPINIPDGQALLHRTQDHDGHGGREECAHALWHAEDVGACSKVWGRSPEDPRRLRDHAQVPEGDLACEGLMGGEEQGMALLSTIHCFTSGSGAL